MNVSKYFERCLWYIGAELQKVSYRYFLFTCHGVWRKHRGNAADRHARFMSPVSTARTAPTWASRIHVRRLSPRGTWVHKLRGAVKWITWHTRSKPGLCHRPASCLSFGVSILMVSLIDLWIWGGPYANKQGFVLFFFIWTQIQTHRWPCFRFLEWIGEQAYLSLNWKDFLQNCLISRP